MNRVDPVLWPLVLAALSLAAHEFTRPAPREPASRAPDIEIWSPPPVAAPTGPAVLTATPASMVRVRAGSGRDAPRAVARGVRGSLQIDEHGAPIGLEFSVELGEIEGDRAAVGAVLGHRRFSTLRFRGRATTLTASRIGAPATVEFLGVVDVGASRTRAAMTFHVIAASSLELRLVGEKTVLGSGFGLPRRWGLVPFGGEMPLTCAWDLVFGRPGR